VEEVEVERVVGSKEIEGSAEHMEEAEAKNAVEREEEGMAKDSNT